MKVTLRWRKLPSGKQSAFLDIHENGSRRHESLSIVVASLRSDPDKVKLAKELRAHKESQLLSALHPGGSSKKEMANADFLIYFRAFVEDYEKKGRRKFSSTLSCFERFTQGRRIAFKDLTKKLCLDFRDYLLHESNGFRGETPFDYFSRFKQVLNHAVEDEYLDFNPSSSVKITRNQTYFRKEVLSVEELRILARTGIEKDDVKRAFLFACNTGLGYAEIVKLKGGNIINGERLKVKREKTEQDIDIPLTDNAKNILAMAELKKNENLFKLPSDTAVNKKIKNWVVASGIDKKITFYCARHTFAVLLLSKANANLHTVSKMMGTTSIQHTSRYLLYTDHLKDDAAKKISRFFLKLSKKNHKFIQLEFSNQKT